MSPNGPIDDSSVWDAAPDLFLFGKLGAGVAAPDSDPARSFLSRLDTDEISEAIRQLPKDYRSVATLYFLEDLSYHEMAEVLGCPIGTVRSRLHRARHILRHFCGGSPKTTASCDGT